MLALWFYLAGSICFVVGTVISLANYEYEEDEETDETTDKPWGFVVQDTSVVDGGEPDWEGWTE